MLQSMIWRLPAARAAASVTASTRPWVLKFAAGLIRAPPCAGFKDSANTIKAGAVLSLDGKLFVVETSTHVEKGAQGKAFYNFELKDMRSGAKKNLRVPPSEKLELVSLNKPAPMSLLYRDGSNLVLMDDETFEQLEVADSIVDSGSRRFLVDGMKLEVRTLDGEVLQVILPSEVPLVAQEVTGLQGGGTGPGTKTMKLDNGVEVKVPAFVDVGDTIVVRTADGAYLKRA